MKIGTRASELEPGDEAECLVRRSLGGGGGGGGAALFKKNWSEMRRSIWGGAQSSKYGIPFFINSCTDDNQGQKNLKFCQNNLPIYILITHKWTRQPLNVCIYSKQDT
jgi:hypothetical protein